ncbi:MAG: hypothetical protein O2895_03900, partial [Chloroflexi bacterium]|nr:hypothetical protein [Chloroflexota bacterium]
MRKIREALRLCLAEGLSPRQTGIATGLPRTTVRRYVERASRLRPWLAPAARADDRALEERLFGRAAPAPAVLTRPVPDWPAVHRELRRKSVTLALLWSEYRTACPDGFGYHRRRNPMDDTTNDQPVGDTHDAPGAIAPADGTPGAGAAGTTGGAAALQADAMKQRWATLGADQRLVVAGAATVLIAYFLGLLLAQWSLGLSSVLSIVGAAAVLVMVLAGPARLLGMSKAAILRISAGVVG